MEVLTVASQKGGVGKTATAVNLAACLAVAGKRTLLIDMDPQASATTHMGIENNMDATAYESIVTTSPKLKLYNIARPTMLDNLNLIPSDKRLGRIEIGFAKKGAGRESILRPKVRETGGYDYIVIDTPPNLGFLTINAMVAADTVIVPIPTEFYGLKGLAMIMDLARAISEDLNPALKLRYLLTMHDRRTKMGREVIDKVRELLGADVYKAVIPRTVRLAEAPRYGKPICLLDPTTPGAKAYAKLAQEVIAR